MQADFVQGSGFGVPEQYLKPRRGVLSVCFPTRVAVGMSAIATEVPPVRDAGGGCAALSDSPHSRGATAERHGWKESGWKEGKERWGIAHLIKGFTALSLLSQF